MQAQVFPSLFLQAAPSRADQGPIYTTVTAPRDVKVGYGHDIYAGQVCFVQRCRMFEGLHAFRHKDRVTVAVTCYAGGGFYQLFWMGYKEDSVLVHKDEVEHLGAVVGCYANDSDPVLWMYSN